MTMTRRVASLLAVAALVLTGCSDGRASAPTPVGNTPDRYSTFLVKTETSGTVECIYGDSYRAGGLSCNWSN